MNKDNQQQCYLVLHVNEQQSVMTWLRVSAAGAPLGDVGQLAAPEVAALAARYPQDLFCLVLPAAAAGLYPVHLPGRHDKAGLGALPWLLEDRLACSVEQMEILPLASQGEMLWAAALDKVRLTDWLAPFDEAGISLHKLLVDALLLPWCEEEACALLLDGRWLIRTALWHGIETEASWLPLWYNAWSQNQPRPVTVRCYGTPVPALAGWQSGTPVEPLVLLARGVPEAHSLLPARPLATAAEWRRPLLAAALVVILLFCQQGVSWWNLVRQGDALQQQLKQAVDQRFSEQQGVTWQTVLRRAVRQQESGLSARLANLPQGITLRRLEYRASGQLALFIEGDVTQQQQAIRLLEQRFKVTSDPNGVLFLHAAIP